MVGFGLVFVVFGLVAGLVSDCVFGLVAGFSSEAQDLKGLLGLAADHAVEPLISLRSHFCNFSIETKL